MDKDGSLIGVVNAKRRENSDLLSRVEMLETGAVSLHGIDLIKLYKALISNVQLGMGYAVPCVYIPNHKEDAGLISKPAPNKESEEVGVKKKSKK